MISLIITSWPIKNSVTGQMFTSRLIKPIQGRVYYKLQLQTSNGFLLFTASKIKNVIQNNNKYNKPISSSTGQHLVDSDHMEWMKSHSNMKLILATVLHHIL
jgi:hypothetical protein